MRASLSLQPNGYTLHQSICNILYSVFENEPNWPEVFVRVSMLIIKKKTFTEYYIF